jgi:hypothetical protein
LPLISLSAIAILALLGVSRVLSYKSGWDELARHYRRRHPFQGRRFRFCFLTFIGFTNYPWLSIGSGKEGLEVRAPFFMRWGHPPLLVPWSAVRLKRRKFLFTEFWELHFPHERNGDGLWVRRGLGEKLLESSGLRSLRE